MTGNPSADDNVWGGEDLKAHLDGQPYITQPVHIAMELEDSGYVNHVAAMPKNLTQNTRR